MGAYLSLIWRRGGGRLFEAGRLLTFSAFRMGAYSRWALIRGWALIRINTVRRLTPFIISIMKSLVIPAIGLALSSVIYSRITIFFALNKVSRGDWL